MGATGGRVAVVVVVCGWGTIFAGRGVDDIGVPSLRATMHSRLADRTGATRSFSVMLSHYYSLLLIHCR